MSTIGKRPLALSALLATATLATAASARTYNITNAKDDNNGCTLRKAIQAANTNLAVGSCAAGQGATDVINLKSSSAYRITGAPLVITESVTIKSNVSGTRRTIVGGPGAATLTLRKSNDVNLTDLILTHEANNGNTAGLVIDGTDSQARLSKVVIKNNNRGVILTDNSKLDTVNTAIHDNKTSGDGGGIFNSASCTIHIEKSSIYKNSANLGGGIFNDGNAEIRDTTIALNTSQQGGGIFMGVNSNQSDMKLTTLTRNTASIGAGLARMGGGTVILYHSILSGNNGKDCASVDAIDAEAENSIADPSCEFTLPDGTALWSATDPELATSTTTKSPENIGFKPASEDSLPRNRGGQPTPEDDAKDQHSVTRKFTVGDPDDGVDIGALELK